MEKICTHFLSEYFISRDEVQPFVPYPMPPEWSLCPTLLGLWWTLTCTEEMSPLLWVPSVTSISSAHSTLGSQWEELGLCPLPLLSVLCVFTLQGEAVPCLASMEVTVGWTPVLPIAHTWRWREPYCWACTNYIDIWTRTHKSKQDVYFGLKQVT